MSVDPVLLDVDGVLADFTGAVCWCWSERFGREFKSEQVTQWDIAEALGIPKVLHAWAWEALRVPGFCRNVGSYPGAIEFVEALRMRGEEVYFVTSPLGGQHWHYERERWLKWFFGAKSNQIIFCHDKHLVRGRALIDDKVETIRAWSKAHPYGTAILRSQPYNAREEWAGPRASSFDEMLRLL